jgi:hypothetical protein
MARLNPTLNVITSQRITIISALSRIRCQATLRTNHCNIGRTRDTSLRRPMPLRITAAPTGPQCEESFSVVQSVPLIEYIWSLSDGADPVYLPTNSPCGQARLQSIPTAALFWCGTARCCN